MGAPSCIIDRCFPSGKLPTFTQYIVMDSTCFWVPSKANCGLPAIHGVPIVPETTQNPTNVEDFCSWELTLPVPMLVKVEVC
jgi:hypothetical protein